MRKRIILAVALLTLLTIAFTSCGSGNIGKISNFDKLINPDYDISNKVYKSDKIIPELTGYVIDDFNDEFVVFVSSEELLNLTYKVLSLRSGTVVATYSDTAFTYDISLYYGLPVYTVVKNEIEPKDGTILPALETTYTLYDAAGNAVTTTDYRPKEEPYFLTDDLLMYNYVVYPIANDGSLKVSEAKDVPEYAYVQNITDYNDEYFYVLGTDIYVYDHNFETVSVWHSPSYINEIEAFVLNGGDIFVQYTYDLPWDSEEYDFIEDQHKFNLVTLILSAEDGKAKEIEFDYRAIMVASRNLIGRAVEDSDMFSDGFDNIAVIAPIVNNEVDDSAASLDMVTVKNNGKIDKSLKIVDYQDINLPRKIADDKFIITTSYGMAIINSKGDVIKKLNSILLHCGNYFIGENAIYDLNLEVVYDLKPEGREIYSQFDDIIYVKEEKDNGYSVLSIHNGETKTVYTYLNDSDDNSEITMIGEIGYVIKSTSGDYSYYNSRGELITTTSYMLDDTYGIYGCGKALLVSEGEEGPTYHIFFEE